MDILLDHFRKSLDYISNAGNSFSLVLKTLHQQQNNLSLIKKKIQDANFENYEVGLTLFSELFTTYTNHLELRVGLSRNTLFDRMYLTFNFINDNINYKLTTVLTLKLSYDNTITKIIQNIDLLCIFA